MVQTRSRAQSRPNSRRSKSIPNPSSSKSTPNTEQFTQEKVQIDSIDNQIVQHNDVLATPNHSLPKSVYTDDDQEEEEGLGESDKLQLAGIIDSISNDVAPTNLPIMNWTMDSGVVNEQDLEEESSDSDEEDATDDNMKVEKELEMELEQESIEYDNSEEEGLNEEMKVIHFNDKGQPIGEGVGPFANKVGKITRKHIPVSYAKWREVPEKTIDAVWKRITDKYIIPVAYKHNIVAKIRASWKKYKSMLRAKHYDSYCTDEERKRNCPKNVKQDDWIKFVDNQSTPAAQAQRLRGKKARQAVKTPHFSGRYGAARVADAMKKKNPSGTISRTEVYVALHSRADGSCTEEVEKIKAIAMENPSSINLDVDHDPVAQVRGPEQNGKAIRGLGCGVSKASLRYSAPAIHHLQQERGLRIAAEKKLVEVGVNVDSPNSAEACSLGQIQNTPILRKRKSISEPRNSSDEATPSGKRIREFEDDNSDMDYEDEEDGGGVSSEEESETEFMESVADDIPSVRRTGFEQVLSDDRWGSGAWRPPARTGVLTEDDVSTLYLDMDIYMVLPERVNRESLTDLVFPTGCVHHGLSLPLEENLAKLLVHFNCSLAEFPPLAMLIYERARELESVFKVPFGYDELVRYFHLTPIRNNTFFRVDFFKKYSGPIGLPQNYSSWRARWFAAAGKWDKAMPGRIPTERRVQVSPVNRKLPHNKNAELNLKFYLEGIDPEWKKMQRPWVAVRRVYGKVKLVSHPYVEEIPSLLVEKKSCEENPDDSETSEKVYSDDMEGSEDDSDPAESCEYKNAEKLDKAMTEVRNAMLEGNLSADDVMQALRLGLVEDDVAHAYVSALTSNAIPEELIRPDQASSVKELRTKHQSDRGVVGTSSSSVACAGNIGTTTDPIDVSDDPAVLRAELARLRAELAKEKAKGKRPID